MPFGFFPPPLSFQWFSYAELTDRSFPSLSSNGDSLLAFKRNASHFRPLDRVPSVAGYPLSVARDVFFFFLARANSASRRGSPSSDQPTAGFFSLLAGAFFQNPFQALGPSWGDTRELHALSFFEGALPSLPPKRGGFWICPAVPPLLPADGRRRHCITVFGASAVLETTLFFSPFSP